ncbi:hypothetical protein FRC04_001690 [Tulasnella sp. 424]|nr:hypothetical protein FRC04_001690 [Tulasnella sp. 424]
MDFSPPLSVGVFAPQTGTQNHNADEEPRIPLEGEPEQPHHRPSETPVIHSIWPDYALPEERLPTPTYNDLRDRVARLSETELRSNADGRYPVRRRKWAKELQMSGGRSASWMILIRSRWLVIETMDCHLELWDLESSPTSNGPVANFDAVAGFVDGYVIVDEAGEPAQLFISTTAHQVYSFTLDLPHRCENRTYTSEFQPHTILSGYSGLRAKQSDWWAFAKTKETSVQGFLYNPQAKTPLVRLACADGVTERQNVLDILLGESNIILIRNTSIDIYNRSTLGATLDNVHPESSGFVPVVKPQQSLPQPKHDFIHHARLFHRHRGRAETSTSSFVWAAFLDCGWAIGRLERDGTDDPTKSCAMYTTPFPRRVAHGFNNPLILEWGHSGSRMIALSEGGIQMDFVDPQPPQNDADWKDYTHKYYGPLLANWRFSDDVEDIPRCAAFDEATGIVVVGMHSGKILVGDAGDSVPPPLTPEEHAEWKTRWLDYPEPKYTSNPPHPSPKRWPGLASIPGYTKPKNVPEPGSAYEVAPGWFCEVERFYPGINQPDAWGGIPWHVQELAGIPSGARCVLVSSNDLCGKLEDDSSVMAVIELDAEAEGRSSRGGLLLLSWDATDPVEPGLYKTLLYQ